MPTDQKIPHLYGDVDTPLSNATRRLPVGKYHTMPMKWLSSSMKPRKVGQKSREDCDSLPPMWAWSLHSPRADNPMQNSTAQHYLYTATHLMLFISTWFEGNFFPPLNPELSSESPDPVPDMKGVWAKVSSLYGGARAPPPLLISQPSLETYSICMVEFYWNWCHRLSRQLEHS